LKRGEATGWDLREQEIGIVVTEYFLQGESVAADDLVGPRLRFQRPEPPLNGDATDGASGFSLDGMNDALATKQVMAGWCDSIIDILKTDGALELLLERFDICLHFGMQLIFVPRSNHDGGCKSCCID
jgi:hypothetical protein